MCLQTDGRLSHQCDCTAPRRTACYILTATIMYWPVTNRELINQLTVTRPPPPPTIYCGVLLSSKLKNTNLNLVVSLNFIFLQIVLMQVASA